MSVYSTILNNFIYGEQVWFLINCYDKPNVFTKCVGIIRGKEVKNNNIRYHIEPIKILESKDNIIRNVQNQKFRMYIHETKRAKLKEIKIVDIIDKIDFTERFQEYIQKYHFVVNNFLCVKTESELESLLEKTQKISKDIINELI